MRFIFEDVSDNTILTEGPLLNKISAAAKAGAAAVAGSKIGQAVKSDVKNVVNAAKTAVNNTNPKISALLKELGNAIPMIPKENQASLEKDLTTLSTKYAKIIEDSMKEAEDEVDNLEAGGTCPKCGNALIAGKKFCPDCGTKVG